MKPRFNIMKWSIVGAVLMVLAIVFVSLYFAGFFTLSFAVLLDSYRRTRGLTARRQVKWLLWGTAAGVFPFGEEDVHLANAPRVGDGVVVLDGSGAVEYASPNAVSALRGAGVGGNGGGTSTGNGPPGE